MRPGSTCNVTERSPTCFVCILRALRGDDEVVDDGEGSGGKTIGGAKNAMRAAQSNTPPPSQVTMCMVLLSCCSLFPNAYWRAGLAGDSASMPGTTIVSRVSFGRRKNRAE